MFVAFMPLHILFCDGVLLFFILRIGIAQNLNLNLIQINLYSIKVWKLERNFFSLFFALDPNLTQPKLEVKGLALTRPNPANLEVHPSQNLTQLRLTWSG
jgi:hypothetical protein